MAASTIPPLSVWPWRTHGGSDMRQSVSITWPLLGDSALHGTCPLGRGSALGRGFGIQNRSLESLDPLARRSGRDHPFPIYAAAPWRERDIARSVGHGRPAREKNYVYRTPPGARCPNVRGALGPLGAPASQSLVALRCPPPSCAGGSLMAPAP